MPKTRLEGIRKRDDWAQHSSAASDAESDRAWLLKLVDVYATVTEEIDNRFATYLHVHGMTLDSPKCNALRNLLAEIESQ